MIEILKSILYGIVEGITEWLPISSTGHMILLEEIMPMNVSKSFWSMFLVVIQLGAIFAVVVLYWNKIFPFKKNKEGKYTSVKSIWILWSKILVATIPAAIIGLALDDWIDAHLYNGFVVAIMLILVGVAFIYIENRNKDMRPSVNSLSALSYKDALIIGLFQVVAAILPGTSRSGATIVGGLMIGVSRAVAAEFTFFLAIPVMFGASLLKLVKFGLAFSVLDRINGMPLANVHAYSFPAGKHTLMLPKGYLQVLGFTAAETKVRNAGLAGNEETMDWLFY